MLDEKFAETNSLENIQSQQAPVFHAINIVKKYARSSSTKILQFHVTPKNPKNKIKTVVCTPLASLCRRAFQYLIFLHDDIKRRTEYALERSQCFCNTANMIIYSNFLLCSHCFLEHTCKRGGIY